MTSREKRLATVVGALAAALLGLVVVRRVVLVPSRQLDQDIATLQKRIGELQLKEAQAATANARVRALSRGVFGRTGPEIAERTRVWLTRLVAASGMRGEPRRALPPRRLRKTPGDEALGWAVRADGSLSAAVRLLHLLTADPHVHRVESLLLAPKVDKYRDRLTRRIELSLTYRTLRLAPGKGAVLASPQPKLDEPPELPEDLLRQYAQIARRDVFRPYIRRQERPRPPERRPPEQPPPPPPPPPAPAWGTGLKLVNLTRWGDEQDITVRNMRTGEERDYKVGQELLGGQIVLVDTRALPSREDPKITVDSRVILRIRGAYWAVDRGQMLTEKRRLTDEELPPALRAGADERAEAPKDD
jgi:hypothetical protein